MSSSESQLLQSPMEQFEIMPLYSMYIGWLDVSVTNQTLILFVIMTAVLCVRASLMSSLD